MNIPSHTNGYANSKVFYKNGNKAKTYEYVYDTPGNITKEEASTEKGESLPPRETRGPISAETSPRENTPCRNICAFFKIAVTVHRSLSVYKLSIQYHEFPRLSRAFRQKSAVFSMWKIEWQIFAKIIQPVYEAAIAMFKFWRFAIFTNPAWALPQKFC